MRYLGNPHAPLTYIDNRVTIVHSEDYSQHAPGGSTGGVAKSNEGPAAAGGSAAAGPGGAAAAGGGKARISNLEKIRNSLWGKLGAFLCVAGAAVAIYMFATERWTEGIVSVILAVIGIVLGAIPILQR